MNTDMDVCAAHDYSPATCAICADDAPIQALEGLIS